MSFDNRVFNVNGKGLDALKKTIELAFLISSDKTKATHWSFDQKHGLILTWAKDKNGQEFPAPLNAEQATTIVWEWLSSEKAKNVELSHWDSDLDHDGSNSKGWRVYLEDWGNIDDYRYVICAIKPIFVWHGK